MTRDEQARMRRIQILSIALEEFVQKGFYGTSTREISKIAGISSGLMFHYFSSKEALYEALVEIGCEKMVFDFGIASHDPLLYFRNILTDIFDGLKNNIMFARMFVFMDNAQHAHGISKRANELLASHDIASQCIPIVKKGQEMGQLRYGDPHALLVAFWGAIQGIAQEVARVPTTPIPDVDWVLDIIKEREEKE